MALPNHEVSTLTTASQLPQLLLLNVLIQYRQPRRLEGKVSNGREASAVNNSGAHATCQPDPSFFFEDRLRRLRDTGIHGGSHFVDPFLSHQPRLHDVQRRRNGGGNRPGEGPTDHALKWFQIGFPRTTQNGGF